MSDNESNIDSISPQPVTLETINAFLKTIMADNRNNHDTLKNLSNRITSLENSNSKTEPSHPTYLNLKRKDTASHGSKGGPIKRSKPLSDNNNNLITEDSSHGVLTPGAMHPVAGSSRQSAEPGVVRPQLGSNTSMRTCSEAQPSSDDDEYENYLNCEVSDIEQLVDINNESDVESHDKSPFDLPVIGDKREVMWKPPTRVMDWFQNVADIELKAEKLDEISESYISDGDVQKHFSPPVLPQALWQKAKTSQNDMFQQRSLLKIQDIQTLAIKPLLSVLSMNNCPQSIQNSIASSIQLLCTANLKTSRLRRALASKFVRKEIRPSLFSQPVTHLNLFGTEFDSAAEQAIKAQNSVQKVLTLPKQSFSRTNNVHLDLNSRPSTSASSSFNPPPSSKPFRPKTSYNSTKTRTPSRRRGGSRRQ